MKTTISVPSDKDLQDLWNELYWDPGKSSHPMVFRYARAVLERWGNIPQKTEHHPISDW